MCVEISLSQEAVVLVDEADARALMAWKWRLSNRGYAIAFDNRTSRPILMHRAILNASPELQVDHINGNRLDNRRSNLRLVTQSENLRGQRKARRDSKTGVRGVGLERGTGRFTASVYLVQADGRRKHHYFGSFATLEEAAKAVQAGREKLFGASETESR